MGGSERAEVDRATAEHAGGAPPATAARSSRSSVGSARTARRPGIAVQRKLEVGPAGDRFEQEADAVARQVVARLGRPDAVDADAVATPAVGAAPMASRIRRATAPEATVGAAGGPVTADVESRIRAARGGGSPLPEGVGSQMASAFGTDFGDVRLHQGAESADINRTLSAQAFTTGSDIFLGGGAPSLTSSAGAELLAHELTHVVQQRGGAQRSMIHRAYKNGDAAKDAPLFEKVAPIDKPLDTGPASQAAKFGITGGNMEHYLERHTFKYQRLNAKTVSPGAGMFPVGTTADDVKAYLDEALQKLPDGTVIGQTPVSTSVDLSNGLRVNLGALKGGKLQAFFPIAGGSNAGFHEYTADELKAIRAEKNKGDGT